MYKRRDDPCVRSAKLDEWCKMEATEQENVLRSSGRDDSLYVTITGTGGPGKAGKPGSKAGDRGAQPPPANGK